MLFLLPALFAATAVTSAPSNDTDLQVRPPRTVKVLPVCFVPKDGVPLTAEQTNLFMRHVEWARKRYSELLPGHITFGVAVKHPMVYRAPETLEFYREQPEGGAPRFANELLNYLKFTRFNCPYILLVLLVNPIDDYPGGGGRPLNGGFNTGGGIVILSSAGLTKYPNFQSTLQHELGHSFGLPHVDVYAYDMLSNDSFMSYNPGHHTNGLIPSKTPGILNPEDIRGLALNQRVFPKLRFDPKKDVPKGYSIAGRIIGLGPMVIPGQSDIVKVTTESGEADGSSAAGIMVGPMTPIETGVKPVFDPETMLRSSKSSTGWVSLRVEFPVEVSLSRIVCHTMPQGDAEVAQSVRVSVVDLKNHDRMIAKKPIKSADSSLMFPKTKGRVWRFEFQTGTSGAVVIRGLEFFAGAYQLFPPLVPFSSIETK